MPASSFRFKLITPEAQVLNEPVTSVIVPMWDGSAGILPNRAPLVGKLGMGELRVTFAPQASTQFAEGGVRTYYIEDGFAHMLSGPGAQPHASEEGSGGGVFTILTSRAVPAEKLTESDLRAQLTAAEAKALPANDQAAADAIRKERERARKKLAVLQAHRGRGGGI